MWQLNLVVLRFPRPHGSLVILAIVLACGCVRTDGGAPARPNLLLISLDTLRADHLGCYGYERETSPNIDRFARDAVLFEWAFSTGGATLPVHMTMLTGLPYHTHDVNDASGNTLDPSVETVAERLASSGYRTGAFVGGGFVQRKWGFDQGFQAFEEGAVTFEKILPRARQWIDEDRSKPFFLFLHTLDIHSDKDVATYDSPPEFRERFVDPEYSRSFEGCRQGKCSSELLAWFNPSARKGEIDRWSFFTPEEIEYMIALYDGGIAYTDWELGRFFDFLRERGLYESSLIVLVSDHGEEFLEHGLMLHHQSYDEVSHVPMIVKLPGLARAGERVDQLVSLIDVTPTILDVAGVEVPPAVQGMSLLPIIEGKRAGRDFVYIAGWTEKLRTKRWSLRLDEHGPKELYDLAADPGERRNVLADHPEVVAELSAKHAASRRRDLELREKLFGAPPEKVHLDDDTVRDLRALGYLQ